MDLYHTGPSEDEGSGAIKVWFGKHKGKRVDQVPPDYID